jgi:hypothetical protein
MAGAARVHGSKGAALAQRERGREKRCSAFLTMPGSCDDGLRWSFGGAGVKLRLRGARSTAVLSSVEQRHGGARARGKLGRAVAAEGERERAAGLIKGGAASACGSFAQRPPRAPADALRLDSIRARAASRRKRGSGASQWALRAQGREPRVRRSGATGSGRAAGRRRETGEGERKEGERADAWAPVLEREENGGVEGNGLPGCGGKERGRKGVG